MEISPEQYATQNALRALTRETLRFYLRHDDPETCYQMVQEAQTTRQASAVTALSELLAPPRGLRQKWRLQRLAWKVVRVKAAEALGHIGDTKALPALVQALSDHDPDVRAQARKSVESFGPQANGPLLMALNHGSHWTLPGMKTIIHYLGASGDKRISQSLVRILFQQSPPAASRWIATTVQGPMIAISLVVLSLWLFLINNVAGEIGSALGGLILLAILGGALFLLLQLCVFIPIGSLWERSERHQLTLAAASALAELRDKKALPAVIEALHEAYPSERAALQRTLAILLSLLKPEDAGLLSGGSLQRMTGMFGQAEPYLTFAILRALEYVGTGVCVPAVERLTTRGRTPEIRAEAERILPMLLARRQREQAPSSLLRPSSAPTDPQDELLRPVHDTGIGTPPEQLLRSSLRCEK